ncbi:MAG TPA: hypothetical protein VGC69_01210 [Bordetella sp.]
MTQPVLYLPSTTQGLLSSAKPILGWNALRPSGLLARVEQAFVAWQTARLQVLTPERLWAPALQDTRSFAEIRRSRRLQRQG